MLLETTLMNPPHGPHLAWLVMRLVMTQLKKSPPPTLDPFQFTYKANKSIEDGISTILHSTLTHLGNINTYVQMLFVDFSSAFSTVIPSKLMAKLSDLGISTSLCNWTLNFLTNRSVLLHPHTEHRSPTRLHTPPCLLLAVHLRLCPCARIQHPCEVRRWHHCCESDQCEQGGGLQRGGAQLPSITYVAIKRSLKKAHNILKDSSYPNHGLFNLLLTGKRYRPLRCYYHPKMCCCIFIVLKEAVSKSGM